MRLRSFVIAASLITLPLTSVQASWFSKESPRAEETHEMHTHPAATASSKKPKAASTRAYMHAMQRMHKHMNAPLSGNADVDFVRQMIPHHQGAVDMAKIQRQYGHDEALKTFNAWVIFAQEQEIAMMTNWLRRRDNGAEVKGAEDYYGDAMMAMHHAMMVHYTGNADLDYVRGMIAHHQGAVDMASIWLREGSDPDLRKLAHGIYNSQTQEIAWMKRWLADHAR